MTQRGTDTEALTGMGYRVVSTLHDLRDPHGPERKSIPHRPGTYVVVRPATSPPEFSEGAHGGKSARQRRTAPVSDLSRAWVDGSALLYVGEGADLRERVALLIRFGLETADGHVGGEWIWRLQDSWSLLLAYRQLPSKAEATREESRMLEQFRNQYGRLPFANRKRGGLT